MRRTESVGMSGMQQAERQRERGRDRKGRLEKKRTERKDLRGSLVQWWSEEIRTSAEGLWQMLLLSSPSPFLLLLPLSISSLSLSHPPVPYPFSFFLLLLLFCVQTSEFVPDGWQWCVRTIPQFKHPHFSSGGRINLNIDHTVSIGIHISYISLIQEQYF